MAGKCRRAILMADDDPEDCMLATEAFTESGAEADFSFVEDGIMLMEYLAEKSRCGAEKLPDLILLDLNMPRKDGREALVEIRSKPSLKHIPIVILTTSAEEKDITFSMKAGANAFITKPATFEQWIDIMKSLSKVWFEGQSC